MPWLERNLAYVYFQKLQRGKTIIERKDGYRSVSLRGEQFDEFVKYLELRDLKVNGRIYYQIPNSEEIEINPGERKITLKENSDKHFAKKLAEILGEDIESYAEH